MASCESEEENDSEPVRKRENEKNIKEDLSD